MKEKYEEKWRAVTEAREALGEATMFTAREAAEAFADACCNVLFAILEDLDAEEAAGGRADG